MNALYFIIFFLYLHACNSSQPTGQPTDQPFGNPSVQPSRQPTVQPSRQPTEQPSVRPTTQPTTQPTEQPSVQPSRQPTIQPTEQPSVQPSVRPTTQPTAQPNAYKISDNTWIIVGSVASIIVVGGSLYKIHDYMSNKKPDPLANKQCTTNDLDERDYLL